MSDQTEAAGKKLSEVADTTATQVKDQADSLIATVAASPQLAKAKKGASKAQQKAAKRGQELGEELTVRGKAAAKQASSEAKKRGKAAAQAASAEAKKLRKEAAAGAPVVAAAARKKGEHALESARDKGGELLLSALESDPGKRVAGTHAGAALKSKLTARKRRRRKIALLLALNAGGFIAVKQLRARRDEPAGAPEFAGSNSAAPVATPTETVAPAATGTAAGEPIAGVVDEAGSETPEVEEQTEAPAVAASEDGERSTDKEA